MSFPLEDWLGACREHLDAFMQPLFTDGWPHSLPEPVRYPLFGGGKRVRPALALAAYQAVASEPDNLAPVLPAMAAVEMIHTYSLVHDDLPALDDDDERRGRPTVHIAFGEPAAILVGDALLTEAFNVLANAPVLASLRIDTIQRLSRAAGYQGMIGGQWADIGLGGPVEQLEMLERLHRMKTGALIEASAVLGGIVAGAEPQTLLLLESYAQDVGLAFQLADDLLDADEDEGDDGPPSYVKLLGRDETRRRAHHLAERAVQTIAQLERPDALAALAQFTVERDL